MWEAALAWIAKNYIPIALASQAASVLFKQQAQDDVLQRQGELQRQERVRQEQMRQREEDLRRALNEEREMDRAAARAANEAAQQQFTRQRRDDAKDALEEQAAERLAPTTVTPEAAAFAQAAPSAPKEVKDEIARQVVDALATARQHAKNAARLRSYGDAQFGGEIALGRAAQDVGRTAAGFGRTADLVSGQMSEIGRQKEVSNSVLNTELEAAKLQGSGKRALADLFGGAGDIAMLYGLTRPKPKPPMPPPIPPVGSNSGVGPYLDIHRGYGSR